jgi:signal transduction histidine kinase
MVPIDTLASAGSLRHDNAVIGLSIDRAIIEVHRGRIRATTDAGSVSLEVFYMTLTPL